jgi:hypothetical protein
MQEISYSNISGTYQDTISICRPMSVPYVWIDSLCIVQDDSEDWLREVGQMNMVYENALFNVSAAGAEDEMLHHLTPLPESCPVVFGGSIKQPRAWLIVERQNFTEKLEAAPALPTRLGHAGETSNSAGCSLLTW